MGGSSSKALLEINNNQLNVNNQSFNSMVENTTKLAINEVIKNTQKCSSEAVLAQDLQIGKLKVTGGSSANITQQQEAKVSLTCIQASTVQSAFTSEMVGQMVADLASNNDQEVLSKLAAASQTEAVNDSLSPPWGGASSETDTKINNNIQNITNIHKQIAVKMKREVERNMTTENAQELINQAMAIQKAKIGEIEVSENSSLIFGQSQAVSALIQSTQQSGVVSQTMIKVLEAMGVKNTDSVSQKGASDVSAEAKATSENKGLGDLVGGIVGSITGLIGNLGMGYMLLIGGVIIACLLLCSFSLYMIFKPSSQQTVGKMIDAAPDMMSRGMDMYGKYKSMNNGYGNQGYEEGGEEGYDDNAGQYGGGLKGFITNLVKFIALK